MLAKVIEEAGCGAQGAIANLEVVLDDLKQRSGAALLPEIGEAVERRRADLLKALKLAEERLIELEQRRNTALDALTFQCKYCLHSSGVQVRVRCARASAIRSSSRNK
jgi:hypothetical protein